MRMTFSVVGVVDGAQGSSISFLILSLDLLLLALQSAHRPLELQSMMKDVESIPFCNPLL